ncbi:hypothetical protein CLV47_1177 [Antricoccus suffuscus]|uniref:Carbon monoxide dehydrogenase subunit G n=1 Tax=Antricoccus suffuscus TaxID=1629062 RepID=A0A2T0ZVJ4_9ACTN|nr:carbon monoxide dehydrogenase subunit G [Antricoccus suffuscus]PRZ40372.1 hypothetical protein CLV47_1177 [Antricoccus suffuscus]
MKIAGEATLDVPPETVWQALNDPSVLAQSIPGCQSLEQVAVDDFKMTVSAGVASIRGTYDGKVALSDKQPPSSYVLRASGAGAPGTVDATCRITLSAKGSGTNVAYDADAVVGGVVAGVGQRMLAGVAKKMAAEFFGNLNDQLTGKAVAAVPVRATPGAPVAFTGRAAAASPGTGMPALDLLSVGVGAGIALLGVIVGSCVRRGSGR